MIISFFRFFFQSVDRKLINVTGFDSILIEQSCFRYNHADFMDPYSDCIGESLENMERKGTFSECRFSELMYVEHSSCADLSRHYIQKWRFLCSHNSLPSLLSLSTLSLSSSRLLCHCVVVINIH